MSNSNPTPTRGVPIELDGRTRHFRYSFKTRREMLEEVGGEEALQKLTGEKLIKVLWYGLKHEDPELTEEQLEEIVDMENLSVVVDAMGKALGYKGGSVIDAANPPSGGSA